MDLPQPPGRAASVLPQMVFSSTIKPSDLSTSTVIEPDPSDQIDCGRTELTALPDVVFSKLTLPDGRAKLLKMDVLSPASPARRPLVVYLTGGGFMNAPKESSLNLRTFVAEAGFVVASIQYRTVPDGGTYADSIADVKSAIRYLRAHSEEYGIDSAHVGLWGQSAGGYLGAMAGLTGNGKAFDEGDDLDQSSRVQAVVDQYGPSDMSRIAADLDDNAQRAQTSPGNPLLRFIEGVPGRPPLTDSPIASGPANPISYVGQANLPFLFLHGDQDGLVSPSQTLILHEALRAANVSSTRYVLHGAGHGDLVVGSDPQSSSLWSTNETMGIIVSFLQRALRRHGRSLLVLPVLGSRWRGDLETHLPHNAAARESPGSVGISCEDIFEVTHAYLSRLRFCDEFICLLNRGCMKPAIVLCTQFQI